MDDVIMLQVAFKFRSLRDGTLIQTCCILRLQKRRFLQFGPQFVVTTKETFSRSLIRPPNDHQLQSC